MSGRNLMLPNRRRRSPRPRPRWHSPPGPPPTTDHPNDLFPLSHHRRYDDAMHVVIFEGSRWPTFAPLSLTRPAFCLASGMSTLLDKQLRYLEPTRLTLWVRQGLVNYCK